MWKFKRTEKPQPTPKPAPSIFSTDFFIAPRAPLDFNFTQPHGSADVAMDEYPGPPNPVKRTRHGVIPDAQLGWYASQGFIGYNACAAIAQHWLVDKVCLMPARDAIRQGYKLDCGSDDTEAKLRDFDKKYAVNKSMKELIHFGRIYGMRIAAFLVSSTDPDYYEKPFNIDGVTPGSYRGITQIDPQWVTPQLTDANLRDPFSSSFYEPTYFMINGRKIHRSHLRIFIPHPVPDVLKPAYNYGGASVPQRIYERVYAAERTANEAPQLALTKRLTAISVNDAALANPEQLLRNLEMWCEFRDNYGVRVGGQDETIQQFDTSLSDLDAVIMTSYQLVAAAGNVPATKLLGTTPKGFNATGDYEAASYREELESIQVNDLDPFLERHYEILARSEGVELERLNIQWAPLDSPTAKEWAEINFIKAQTDNIYVQSGAIDGAEVRDRIRTDPESDYVGIEGANGLYEDPFGLGDFEGGDLEESSLDLSGGPESEI